MVQGLGCSVQGLGFRVAPPPARFLPEAYIPPEATKVCPDTSPRGVDIEGNEACYEFGKGDNLRNFRA